MKNYLHLYRIINWKQKISGLRPIGYSFFAYLMAGEFSFLPLFFNTLAVFGELTFLYLVNDYYDWKIQQEKNFLSQSVEEGNIPERKIWIFFVFPLLFCVSIMYIIRISPLSVILFLMGFLLVIFYSCPPMRLKERKILGFLIPPIAIFILFLQGYFILGIFTTDIIFLAGIVFLFQIYLETLHVIEDSLHKEEPKKITLDTAKKLLVFLPLFSLIVSLPFSLTNQFFLISAIFSLIRRKAIASFDIKRIHEIRTNLFGLELSLYEFGIYGALGALRLF